MGKAVIVGNVGRGLYKAKLKYSDRLDALLAKLQAEKAEADKKTEAARATLGRLAGAAEAASAGLNALIELWRANVINATISEPPPIDPEEPDGTPEVEQPAKLIARINSARSTPLGRVLALDRAAAAVAGSVASLGYLSDRNGTPEHRAAQFGYRYDPAGGVKMLLAFGKNSANAVADGWLLSVSSAPALLDPARTEVGAAYVYRPDNPYAHVWCLFVAAPGSAEPAGPIFVDPAAQAEDDTERALAKIDPPKTDNFAPARLFEACAKMAKAAQSLRAAKSALAKLIAGNLERDRKIAALSALKNDSPELHIWSARYDDKLAAGTEVTTAEVPGYRDPAQTPNSTTLDAGAYPYSESRLNIVPAPPVGQLAWSETLPDAAVFVNLTLEAAHLRWRPFWRYGTIFSTPSQSQPTAGPTTFVELISSDGGETYTFSTTYEYKPCDSLVVAPYGVDSGGVVTPAATPDQVQVGDIVVSTPDAAGADPDTGLKAISGGTLACARSDEPGCCTTSLAVGSDFQVQAFFGAPGLALSTTPGTAGGSPLIPPGFVEFARVALGKPRVGFVKVSEISLIASPRILGARVVPGTRPNTVLSRDVLLDGNKIGDRDDIPCKRATGADGVSPAAVCRVTSLVVYATGLSSIPGKKGVILTNEIGGPGGPPEIPQSAIEIARVRLDSSAPAAIKVSEIAVSGVRELRAQPGWRSNPHDKTVTFSEPLPLAHAGGLPKKVFAKVVKRRVFGVAISAAISRASTEFAALPLDGPEDIMLWDVPTTYPCLYAFDLGDEVLIEYLAQDRSRPNIVGFRREPRACFVGGGLLRWSAFAPAYPLQIWTGDWAKTFSAPKKWDGEKYPSDSWLSTAPHIQYPHLTDDLFVADEMRPERYTGLARLAMQATHAVKRFPGDLFITYPKPTIHGIWRGAEGRYWSIELAGTGGKARLMQVPSANEYATRALQMLLAGEYANDRHRDMIEAEVLAGLEMTGDEITFVSPAQMGAIAALGAPLGHGWHFARGRMEAAVVVRVEEEMPEFPGTGAVQNRSTPFVVTAHEEQVGGVWRIALDAVSQPYPTTRWRPRAGWTNLYRPLHGTAGLRYFPVTAEAVSAFGLFAGNIAQIYCFYDKNDVLQRVWYIQHSSTETQFDTRPSNQQCGLSEFDASGAHGWTGEQVGGFAVSASVPSLAAFAEPNTFREELIDRREITASGAWEVTHSTSSDNPFLSAMQYFCDQSGLWDWYTGGGQFTRFGSVTYQVAAASQFERLERRNVRDVPSAWACIISYSDPCGVYIVRRAAHRITSPRYSTQRTVASGSPPIYGGSVTMIGHNLQGDVSLSVSRPFSANVVGGAATHNGTLGYVGSVFTIEEAQNLPQVEGGNTVFGPAAATLHAPTGEITLDMSGVWNEMFPDGILDAHAFGLVVDSMFSHAGDGRYFTSQGVSAVRGGYPDVPGSESFFVGGA